MRNIMVKFLPATCTVVAVFLTVAKRSAGWVYSKITLK